MVRHIAGRIVALIGRLEVYLVFQPIVFNEGKHAVGGVLIHILFDGFIASAGERGLFQHKVVVHAENLGQSGGN